LHIETGLTAILNAATAIFGILFAAIAFSDERLTRAKTIGVLFGFAGVVIAIGADSLRSFDIRSLAQLAIVGACISYGLASVWARKTLKSLPPHTAALGMLTGSSLFMLPLSIAIDGPPSFALQPQTWVAIFLGAITLDETIPATALLGFAVIALGMIILDGRLMRALIGAQT
jgi:drug/metabolite transporter (DMT)-like permease